MRFVLLLLPLLAAVVAAQQNAINVPSGGLQIVANDPVTITWSDPSEGTVTIKLQQAPNITPDTGLVLASGIPASSETATFTIRADEVNSAEYTIEIIQDDDLSQYNFSPNFTIVGATGTGTMTASSASITSTGSSSFSFTTPTSSSTTISPSSATPSQPISSPTPVVNDNGASTIGVQGSLLAAVIGALVAF